ncbi:MAG TPA: hypothetical protein VFA04_04205 [Bryobacteraceae bacterium]|nr:hypothetical protein [Bryobacteraceae bacterium]
MKFFPTAAVLLLTAASAATQQIPNADRNGNPVVSVRNDAAAAISIEYRRDNQWQQIRLEPGTDATIGGDRIRVATTRRDNAVITVELPVQPGKKYRLVWNGAAAMWDFSATR